MLLIRIVGLVLPSLNLFSWLFLNTYKLEVSSPSMK